MLLQEFVETQASGCQFDLDAQHVSLGRGGLDQRDAPLVSHPFAKFVWNQRLIDSLVQVQQGRVVVLPCAQGFEECTGWLFCSNSGGSRCDDQKKCPTGETGCDHAFDFSSPDVVITQRHGTNGIIGTELTPNGPAGGAIGVADRSPRTAKSVWQITA